MVFLDATLYLAILPLLPEYERRFGLGTAGAALLLASYPLATPVISLLCIRLLPRFGGRGITLLASALTTVATVAFALAPNAEVLIGARFVQGVASGTVWAASMAWVTHNAPIAERGREAGIVMGLLSTGSVVGPAIGAIAAWVGFAPAFLGVAAIAALGTVLVWLAPTGLPLVAAPGILASLRRVRGHDLVRAAVAMALIDTLAFGAVDVLVPLNLGDHGVSTAGIALALGIGAVLGAATGPFAGRAVDRLGARRVSAASAVGVVAIPLLLALAPGVWTGVIVLIVGSPIYAVVGSAMYPLGSVGADESGVPHVVVSGLLGAVWAAGFTISAAVAGTVASLANDKLAFAIAFVGCVPLLILILRGVSPGRVAAADG